MHLRVEENRCGQPHCRVCRNAPRKATARDYAGLIGFGTVGAVLLVLVVLATVLPR